MRRIVVDTRPPLTTPYGSLGTIPSMNGIRALSILIVFTAHAGLPVFIDGSAGVTIFFFLSGYLITTLFRVEHERTGGVRLRDFYTRRALRILPPMYLALALGILVAATGVASQRLTLPAIASAAAHLTNYRIIEAGRGGLPASTLALWSLAVEEHFYLVFPLIFSGFCRWLPSRRRAQTIVLASMCSGTLAWRCWLVLGSAASFDRVYLATDTRLDSILLGCLMAVAFNPALDRVYGSERLWTRVLLPLGGLAFFMATRVPDRYELSVGYTVEGAALMLVFTAVIRFPAAFPAQLLNLRPVAFLGVLSYSFYLLHGLMLDLVSHHFSHGLWANAVVAGLLSIAGSWAVYHLVETPAARLRKRLLADR